MTQNFQRGIIYNSYLCSAICDASKEWGRVEGEEFNVFFYALDSGLMNDSHLSDNYSPFMSSSWGK